MRERGLKFSCFSSKIFPTCVAPVRERGLKFTLIFVKLKIHQSRSREGAWIEIAIFVGCNKGAKSRSREGAWIEMKILVLLIVLFLKRRSREGAWIEIFVKLYPDKVNRSLP